MQPHLRVCAGRGPTHPRGHPCAPKAGPPSASWPRPAPEPCGTRSPAHAPLAQSSGCSWDSGLPGRVAFWLSTGLDIPAVPQVSVVSVKQRQPESRQRPGHPGARSCRGCCRWRLARGSGRGGGRWRSPQAQRGSCRACWPEPLLDLQELRVDRCPLSCWRSAPQTWVTTVGVGTPHLWGGLVSAFLPSAAHPHRGLGAGGRPLPPGPLRCLRPNRLHASSCHFPALGVPRALSLTAVSPAGRPREQWPCDGEEAGLAQPRVASKGLRSWGVGSAPL